MHLVAFNQAAMFLIYRPTPGYGANSNINSQIKINDCNEGPFCAVVAASGFSQIIFFSFKAKTSLTVFPYTFC